MRKINREIEETDNLIVLKKLTKSFGERVVLDELDITIKKGEIITIMGKSGAGKTTILNILGFLDYETNGEYIFMGKRIKTEQERSYLRNKYMGFVFQSYNLIPKLTVYENIVLPVYYSISSSKEKKERIGKIPELLKRFNIEHISKSYVECISGGEKQRVCLARALVCEPELIISDEPTGNLDEENSDIVLNELKKINQEGKTVIIVTHDSFVEKIAEKKYYLSEGKLISNEK